LHDTTCELLDVTHAPPTPTHIANRTTARTTIRDEELQMVICQ
jgi:hypothetical protein